jgi:hypothetical protein
MMPVVKGDDRIQRCTDYKTTGTLHMLDAVHLRAPDTHHADLHFKLVDESALTQTYTTTRTPFDVKVGAGSFT